MTRSRSDAGAIEEAKAVVEARAAAFVAKHLADTDVRAGLALLLTSSLILERGAEDAIALLERGEVAEARACLHAALIVFGRTR